MSDDDRKRAEAEARLDALIAENDKALTDAKKAVDDAETALDRAEQDDDPKP